MNNTILHQHFGVKLINAVQMTREEYNELRGWTVPADENPEDAGYLVEYVDGGKANHPDYAGYISWSPKDVFERAYRPVNGMTFGLAIEALKQGLKVARSGWNGKGMWLRLLQPYAPHPDTIGGRSDGVWTNPYFVAADNNEYAKGTMLPWIGMKTADNCFVPWLASQTDMLAEDWVIIE